MMLAAHNIRRPFSASSEAINHQLLALTKTGYQRYRVFFNQPKIAQVRTLHSR
jgi:hypothetical protein